MDKKIGFISLGCPKATVDSELILTQLRSEGYQLVSGYEESDLIIVNTCGFINDAIDESLETIGEAIVKNGKVIVTGCLGKRADLIRENYPEVLAITGANALEEVMEAVHLNVSAPHEPFSDLIPPAGLKLTPSHYAYLKIAEGCNQNCSFCVIPNLRGKLVSRPINKILDEATHLVNAGVRELLIVSQDTASYGVDVKYQTTFWQGRPLKTRISELAKQLGNLDAWIRLHYVYPYPHVDELVELMAEGFILPYLDIPLQHASPNILKAMKRPANVENMLKRIQHWRNICPDLTIRSTFIVGFPNETEQEFNELLDFLVEAQLDRVGAFAYSNVEGAPANSFENQIDEETKAERLEHFMRVQSEISANKLQNKIGSIIPVIIDAITNEGIIARSSGEAPEVDGVVWIDLPTEKIDVEVGDFVDVEIRAADEHDLYASLITDFEYDD
ncbi:MAG: ribosomal protein methylthiotransferase RimO [Pseudomonadota bacterium]|jgi:ribosomal protein S12 methylthiotransferase